ncbi:MAG TPA: MBL fold metallo-hydrolase [Syntrophales bacterium]|jgi:glyoxylase-like metal-dependent hydrolase (beta-lactamase superfamily II)|nr:MBL fold metallo-hydrolase [Syntrophales bacterium]
MRHRKAGKVAEGIWYLGREETGLYVLEGTREAMIVSGGMVYILPQVVRQMESFGIDRRRITRVLILHAHFDHLGVIPWWKRTFPDTEVLASSRAWEVLSMPKAVATINEFSRMVTERMGLQEGLKNYDYAWRDDVMGRNVREDDRIELGGLSVRILETPGHSSCSISAYVPEWKALFASDGGGIPFRDFSIPLGNSDFTKFEESLEKMDRLPVDCLCADHYGFITGVEAGRFIGRTREAAKILRRSMEKALEQHGGMEEAARALTGDLYRLHPDYFMSPEITEGIFRQMIRHVAGGAQPS